MTDIMNNDSVILVHVKEINGLKVSKYRVNVENVHKISDSAIYKALKESDLINIDEIAPMET